MIDVESQERDEVEEVEKLTKKDSLRVFLWHKLVTAMMVATSVAVSTASFHLLSLENKEDYETAFSLFTNSIRDSARLNAGSIINAATAFSSYTSSYAKAMNATWPFVTVPNFEVQVSTAKKSTRAERVLFLPLVEDEDYDKWNQYVQREIGWRVESLQTLGRSENLSEPISSLFVKSETAENWTVAPANEVREAPYSPYWQSSPPQITKLINLDTYIFIGNRKYATSMEASRKHIFGAMFPVDPYVGEGLDYEEMTHDELHAAFTEYTPAEANRSSGWATAVPHSTFLCPIFETDHDIQSKIVARFSYILPWDAFLTNLLPEGTKDMVAVLSNSGNQTASFILRGNNALFTGWEDKHDQRYDNIGVPIDFTELAGISKDDYSEVEDSGAHLYNLTIYPTQDFEDFYKNNTPVLFVSVIATAFFFTTLAFCTYGAMVQCRNTKVVQTAANSNAIFTTLFPSTVRDRIHRFLSKDGGESAITCVGHKDETESLTATAPIADLFPETTIMFGDLVGFTSWSSARDPCAVFTLLETIYSAFDKIAKGCSVFKVETIGDCYVAVAGCPTPCEEHATVMSRFAMECLRKLPVVTKDLAVSLGRDTADLAIRIGLHSGSVTAGVLRGERARFQLFGDTMNTASRMESTGEAGRIQISQETACRLSRAGKMQWFQRREAKVEVKGKGHMQTFWLVSVS